MLEHFFSPKTVAVVGASREEGKVGHDLFKNLVRYGYKGKIYPVNPHTDNILGIKTYTALKEIPDKIDLAVIVVPAPYVGKTIDECIEKGIDSVIVISAGFKESGIDGAARERELYHKIKQHDGHADGSKRLFCSRHARTWEYSVLFTIRGALHFDSGLGGE